MDYGDLEFTTQLEFALQIKKRLKESKKCYPQVILNGMQYGAVNDHVPIKEEEDLEQVGFLPMREEMRAQDEKGKVIYEKDQEEVDLADKLVVGKHLVGVTEGRLTSVGADGESKLLDTKNHISHGKGGFAAFVMNKHGKLLIFNHKDGDDKIKHSSFSNGEEVVGAGELRIEGGILTHITVHSGHYKPTVNDVSNVLKKLKEQGLDVDQVKILAFEGAGDAPDENISDFQETVDTSYIQLVITDTIAEIKDKERGGQQLSMNEKLAILNQMYDDYIGRREATIAGLGLSKQIIAKELFEQEAPKEFDLEAIMERLKNL